MRKYDLTWYVCVNYHELHGSLMVMHMLGGWKDVSSNLSYSFSCSNIFAKGRQNLKTGGQNLETLEIP